MGMDESDRAGCGTYLLAYLLGTYTPGVLLYWESDGGAGALWTLIFSPLLAPFGVLFAGAYAVHEGDARFAVGFVLLMAIWVSTMLWCWGFLRCWQQKRWRWWPVLVLIAEIVTIIAMFPFR